MGKPVINSYNRHMRWRDLNFPVGIGIRRRISHIFRSKMRISLVSALRPPWKVHAYGCVVALLVSIGCQKEEMRTVRVPKESDAPPLVTGDVSQGPSSLPDNHPPLENNRLPDGHPPVGGDMPPGHPEVGGGEMSMANALAQGVVPPSSPQGDVTWVVPRGWQEKPGSGFRYATFVVPGKGALAGDLSVIVLEGDAGGLLPNVNRWRGQIGLPELTESQLSVESTRIRPGGRAMTLVSFASTDALIEGKEKKRLMAAVYSSAGNTWFFKLVGEDRLVQSAERDFLEFLKSLKGL
jgi:hypothetical protein